MNQNKNQNENKEYTDDEIWIIIQLIIGEKESSKIDEFYKKELINGYKLCKNKKYNFKNLNEQEKYFSKFPEEEAYYDKCIHNN
jgi:hypothetical protein